MNMLNTLAAWILLGFYLAFVLPAWRTLLGRLSKRLGDWTVGLLLLPYLLAVSLQPEFGDLLRFVIYLALPTLWLRLRPPKNRPFDGYHILTILCIWVPVEFDLFVLGLDLIVPFADVSAWLSGLYLLPSVTAALIPGVDLPIDTLTGAVLALFLFTVHYPLDDHLSNGIGFTFRLSLKDLENALSGLLAYAVVGIPLGVGLGFLRYDPKAPPLLDMLGGLLAGYLLVALVEEMLFRGVIQNLLAERLRKPYMGLGIAAVIFGLAHLNNTTSGFSEPNWAYALMAGLAGLSYGWVWMRTGKVTASAITHALVNFMWWIVF
jgi:hypothetical protein